MTLNYDTEFFLKRCDDLVAAATALSMHLDESTEGWALHRLSAICAEAISTREVIASGLEGRDGTALS